MHYVEGEEPLHYNINSSVHNAAQHKRQKEPKSEQNPMDSGVQLRAQQSNSPTHIGKDMNIAYARQSEHFKVSAQDVQMFSLAISSEAKL